MCRILIVQDDMEINRVLCRLLEQGGYTPVPALDGFQALQALEYGPTDMVLLDLMLPGVNGEPLLTEIRQSSDVPVMILSAKTNMEGKVELLRQGADDYIANPSTLGGAGPYPVLSTQGWQGRKCSLGDLRSPPIARYQAKTAAVAGVPVNEYRLLETLVLHPHTTFSKRQLFEMAWR